MSTITTESEIYLVTDTSYDAMCGTYSAPELRQLVSEWDEMEPLEAPRVLDFTIGGAEVDGEEIAEMLSLEACDACGAVGCDHDALDAWVDVPNVQAAECGHRSICDSCHDA